MAGRNDGWCKRGDEEREREHPDTARLDWFDGLRSHYIEGQNQSWPYGEHTANEWSLIWPETDLRSAIDAAMENARINAEEAELAESMRARQSIEEP